MTRTTAIVAALALFARPITADDDHVNDLCLVDSDWNPDATVQTTCMYAYSSEGDLVENDCPTSDGFQLYYNMYCIQFGLTEAECTAYGAPYYQEDTCSDFKGEWDYTGQVMNSDTCFIPQDDDSDSLFKTMSEYSDTCCGGGISKCADVLETISPLCADGSNYVGSYVYSQTCFVFYDSTDSFSSDCPTDDSNGFVFMETGDGVSHCYSQTITTEDECLAAGGTYFQEETCDDSYDQWYYGEFVTDASGLTSDICDADVDGDPRNDKMDDFIYHGCCGGQSHVCEQFASDGDGDDDDDCEEGYQNYYCNDDGHVMLEQDCTGDTCGDSCSVFYDYTDYSGGTYTCDAATGMAYYDEDLDGTVDEELPSSEWSGCHYNICDYDADNGVQCGTGDDLHYDSECRHCDAHYTGDNRCDSQDCHWEDDACNDGGVDGDDDGDCYEGYENIYCNDDGHVMFEQDCTGDTCGSSCSAFYDYTDYSGGTYYCDAATGMAYYDEDLDGTVDETRQLPGCYYNSCGADDDWIVATLYEGDTSGYGDHLAQTITTESWSKQYEMYITITMPDDLSEIGERAGLLGNENGDHPYPYFNQDGLWYEKQNGPHDNIASISSDFFEAGETYNVGFNYDGNGCFGMWIEDNTDSEVWWCYGDTGYDYAATPQYAGCGYGLGNELFPGSVTKVFIQGYIEVEDSTGGDEDGDDDGDDWCADSSDWYKSGKPSKDCDWVKRNPGNRCEDVGEDGTTGYDSCPESCGTCPGSTPAPTPCTDSMDWGYKGKSSKDCDWVAKKPAKHCAKDDGDDWLALSACPVTCGTCGCSDSTEETWLYKGKSGKSCDFVAKKPSKYCDSEDDYGTTAGEACPMTCGNCGCQDSLTWLYKGKSGKDCDWMSKKTSKCSKYKDKEGTKAKHACPVTCGEC